MLKLGTRRVAGSVLTLRKATALPAHMRGPIVELSNLRTERARRGQGRADELMQRTTVEADLAGAMLFLVVDPGDDETDRDRLIAFYARNGFVPIQAEPLLMIRPHVGMRATGAA